MIREILRKLRSGAIISLIWGGGLGLATLILVAGSFLIPSLSPSTEDLVQIPLWAAAGGFFLGTVFSTAAVLGARGGRLSRWKAGLIGILSGPFAAVGYNLIEGRPTLWLVGQSGLLLGLLIGAVAFLMVSLVSVPEPDTAPNSSEPDLIDEPVPDFSTASRTAQPVDTPAAR